MNRQGCRPYPSRDREGASLPKEQAGVVIAGKLMHDRLPITDYHTPYHPVLMLLSGLGLRLLRNARYLSRDM